MVDDGTHLAYSAPTGINSGALATVACLLHIVSSSRHNIFHCARYEKLIHHHIFRPCNCSALMILHSLKHCFSLCQCSKSAVGIKMTSAIRTRPFLSMLSQPCGGARS